MDKQPRFTGRQLRQVRSLIRKRCCNFDGGTCLLFDDPHCNICPQWHSGALVCKWFRYAVLPNDPVLEGKKLCGILTELSLEGETGRVQDLVLGIGINVSQRPEDFTPEVREIATSLAQALGRPVSRPALAAEVIRELDRLYAALTAGEIAPYLAEYRRRCVNLGRTVRLLGPDGGETAEALDIDGDFGLVVRTADGGIRTVRSGEVSVRGLYGYTE